MTSSAGVNSSIPTVPFYPVQSSTVATTASTRPFVQQTLVPDGHDLGELSANFESAKPAASAVGYDPTGGWSFGTFQIASKTGTMALFLNYLKTALPQASALLENAGGSGGALQGTTAFKKAWQLLAADTKLGASFSQVQYGFIKTQHFDVLASKVLKDTGLNVAQRSVALQNVLWSVATQHGPKSSVISNALSGKDVSKMTDKQLIEAIYAERAAVDVNRRGMKVARYFPSSPPSIQANVLDRFDRELQLALSMLRREISIAQ
jgi:hypothetical protein